MGVDGVGGWGCGWVWIYGVLHASTHVHVCMHVHTCTCMLNMINMDAEAAICNY